jgi:uncharacterized membrane protein
MDQILANACATCGDSVEMNTVARQTSSLARVVIALDRIIYRIARHWLFLTNSVFFTHVMTLLLAPALVAWGHSGLARPIYAFNGLFCHQRDDRSFAVLGEKMACCQRCAAIYGAIMLTGLCFTLLRGRIQRPRVSDLLLLAMPVTVDGGAQLIGLWESTAATRVLSGTLLGIAICWFLLPYLETGFARMRLQLETLFARLVSEGRAQPL